MQYGEGRTKIEGLDKIKGKEIKKKREILENGTIVYCKGSQSTSSFIGIVYDNCRVLEIENGSSAYINSDNSSLSLNLARAIRDLTVPIFVFVIFEMSS